MYHFQESYNKRLKSNSNDQQQSAQTVFKAKQERFEAINNADKLQNRVKHLLEQQNKTNLKIQQQNERTIQLLKKKFQSEQMRHEKKMRNQDNNKDLEQLKEKVKQRKIEMEKNVKANQEKVQQMKQQRHRSIKNEDLKHELQAKEIKQKIQNENQQKTNIVKNVMLQSKLNIEHFWDQKTSEFELNRNLQIEEQGIKKSQKQVKLQELGRREQKLMENFKYTLNQQDQSLNQLNSIKAMSTKQFKEKYPDFYEQVVNGMTSPKSPQSNKENTVRSGSMTTMKMNKKLQTIYMIDSKGKKRKQ